MWIVRTKKSPYWQARWWCPGGGGVICRSTGETAKRAAGARGEALEAEYVERWKRDQGGGAVTAERVIEEWWRSEASGRKSALDHIAPHLARIRTFLGERAYCEVSIADVAAFVDQLGQQVSRSTVNRAISVWRRMHNYAGQVREYPVRPINWRTVRQDEPVPSARHITREQVADVLDALPTRLQEIVVFALMTGTRRSQIVGLTWDRVDLDRSVAVVWRKHRRAEMPHEVELNGTALRIVERRLAATGGRAGPVFNATNLRHAWEAATRAAGCPEARFHDLRHTAGHWLSRNGVPLAVIQRLFGHASITTTMRYNQVGRDDVRAGVARLPEIELSARAK